MKFQFLYRALRKEEIDAGYILLPKGDQEFAADPVFGIDTTFPFKFYSSENAVRQHQWKQNGLPTRGISTTPLIERAVFYGKKHRVIMKINTSKFEKLSITTYDVNEILGFRAKDIAVPEDNEIIIVNSKNNSFPTEIIEEIIKI